MAEPRSYRPADVENGPTVEGFQLRPDTWSDLADWCGGHQLIVDGGQAVALGSLDPDRIALLGDHVMWVRPGTGPDAHEVSRADGHLTRWTPAESF